MSTAEGETNFASMGERLRSERQRVGLSQSDCGALSGVTRATMAAWERGDQAPNAGFLQEAARVGMDVLYIVTGAKSEAAFASERFMQSDEIALLTDYRKADSAHQAAARLLLSAVAKACHT